MNSYALLERKCDGCADGRLYTVRFYNEPMSVTACYRTLPQYVGACTAHIRGNNCHITAMSMHEGGFERHHQLDLLLRLLENEPELVTATFERHKAAGEVRRTVNIIDRIRFLTR
jgi:hypothetical protein